MATHGGLNNLSLHILLSIPVSSEIWELLPSGYRDGSPPMEVYSPSKGDRPGDGSGPLNLLFPAGQVQCLGQQVLNSQMNPLRVKFRAFFFAVL